ncbi:MAG: cytochrome P450 [Actinobacteria bacterium]|nr:cytochrome P450 [Actinomycetota bacterium]
MRYDPWDEPVMADPYPAYERLRAEAPCYQNPERGFFVLSRHGDVARGLRSNEQMISGHGVALQEQPSGLFVSEDPPSHTKTRRVAARAFTKPAMAKHQAFVADVAERVVADGLAAVGPIDAIGDVANRLAFEGLVHVLGVPDVSPADCFAMSEAVFRSISDPDGKGIDEVNQLGLTVGLQVDGVVEERKRSNVAGPGDVVDAVVARTEPDDDGWRLNRYGRSEYVTALIGPGLETTRHLVGNGIELIARHPEEWARVRNGEVAASAFVEEVLRFEAPVQGFFRTASEPVAVDGAQIPAGSRVLMLYGSANRDEHVFDDAGSFRPARDATEHLAFGLGIHYCLGAGLARLEATALFEALARAVDRIDLAGDGERCGMALMRGWRSLPVQFVAG